MPSQNRLNALSSPESDFAPARLSNGRPSHSGRRTAANSHGPLSLQETKKDRRLARHNALLARVSGTGSPRVKRRRPAKKLTANMADLEMALNDIEGVKHTEDEWKGLSGDDSENDDAELARRVPNGLRRRKGKAATGVSKIAMTSVKLKPGAMPRKRAMEVREMERFQRNLAQLAARPVAVNGSTEEKKYLKPEPNKGDIDSVAACGPALTMGEASYADKWAALRSFISSTMDHDRAFANA